MVGGVYIGSNISLRQGIFFINKYMSLVYIHIGFKKFQFRKAHKVAKALIQIKVEILIKIYPIIG